MEPASKKRANDRELNKDNYRSDESGDEAQPGEMEKAEEGVLKERKIIKARRPGATAEPITAPPPTITSTATTTTTTNAAAAAPAMPSTGATNPFANVSLFNTMPTIPTTNAADTKAATEPKPAAASAFASSGFSGFAAGSNPFASVGGGGASGGGAAGAGTGLPATTTTTTTTGGFGAFGGFSSGGFGGFGAAASTGGGGGGGFGFGLAAAKKPEEKKSQDDQDDDQDDVNDEEDDKDENGFKFGSDKFPDVPGVTTGFLGHTNDSHAIIELPPAPERIVTGEEEETTLLHCDGKLYAFDKTLPSKWKERGSGELRLNLDGSTGQARLLMRQKGNMRLILNANLWGDMSVNVMEGGRGITFSVVNTEEGGGEGDKDKDKDKEGLMTYAFRTAAKDVQPKLIDMINKHKKREGGKGENGDHVV